MLSASGGLRPPDQGLCPWTPLGASSPDPRSRSRSPRVLLAPSVHPTVFDLAKVGGHDPHFLAVWRSKEVVVHLYIDPHPLFTGMLTATAACYKLLTRPISRCDCREINYLTQL